MLRPLSATPVVASVFSASSSALTSSVFTSPRQDSFIELAKKGRDIDLTDMTGTELVSFHRRLNSHKDELKTQLSTVEFDALFLEGGVVSTIEWHLAEASGIPFQSEVVPKDPVFNQAVDVFLKRYRAFFPEVNVTGLAGKAIVADHQAVIQKLAAEIKSKGEESVSLSTVTGLWHAVKTTVAPESSSDKASRYMAVIDSAVAVVLGDYPLFSSGTTSVTRQAEQVGGGVAGFFSMVWQSLPEDPLRFPVAGAECVDHCREGDSAVPQGTASFTRFDYVVSMADFSDRPAEEFSGVSMGEGELFSDPTVPFNEHPLARQNKETCFIIGTLDSMRIQDPQKFNALYSQHENGSVIFGPLHHLGVDYFYTFPPEMLQYKGIKELNDVDGDSHSEINAQIAELAYHLFSKHAFNISDTLDGGGVTVDCLSAFYPGEYINKLPIAQFSKALYEKLTVGVVINTVQDHVYSLFAVDDGGVTISDPRSWHKLSATWPQLESSDEVFVCFIGSTEPMNHPDLGQGIRTLDGAEYYGERRGDMPNGQGLMILNDGEVQEGDFKQGRLIKGKWTKSDGRVYEGEFDEFGAIVYGTVTLSDGSVYDGEFHPSGFFLKGKVTLSNGEVYEGEFDASRNFVKGTITLSNGEVKVQ